MTMITKAKIKSNEEELVNRVYETVNQMGLTLKVTRVRQSYGAGTRMYKINYNKKDGLFMTLNLGGCYTYSSIGNDDPDYLVDTDTLVDGLKKFTNKEKFIDFCKKYQ